MKKKAKQIEEIQPRSSSYTAAELEEMAWSLVNRGLASIGILEMRFSKPPKSWGFQRQSQRAFERSYQWK